MSEPRNLADLAALRRSLRAMTGRRPLAVATLAAVCWALASAMPTAAPLQDPAPMSSPSCSCDRAIPVPGDWVMEGNDSTVPVVLSVVPGDDGECGGRIQILDVPVHGTLDLACAGDRYLGATPLPGGSLQMELAAEHTGRGLTLATRMTGTFTPASPQIPHPAYPVEMRYVGGSGGAFASDCLCDRVKGFIESSEQLRAAYADGELVRTAVEKRIPGRSTDVGWIEDRHGTGSKQAWELSPDADWGPTFEQFVLHRVFGPEAYNGIHDDDVAYAAASTDPETCEIRLADARDSNGRCQLSVELDAAVNHERIHQNNCLAVNGWSAPMAADPDDEEASAYSRWNNHPRNHGDDEAAAYDVTLDILRDWADAHCGGSGGT